MKKILFILQSCINSKIIFFQNILYYLKSKKLRQYPKKYRYHVLIIILIIFIIRTGFSVYLFNYKYNKQQYNKSMNLLILNKEKQTESYISYLVKIEEKNRFSNMFVLYIYKDKDVITDDDITLFFNNNGNFKYGDIVKIKGKILIPEVLNNLHEFNYKRYLNSKNIVGSIMTYNAEISDHLKSDILSYIYKLKDGLESIIDGKLPKTEANLFKSMIYGDDKNLDENIKENFTKLGLSHLLAVSGSNVGIVILILSYIFKKVKLNKFISFVTTCLFIFAFCAISGFEVSVLRASIISIIFLFTSLISLKLNKYLSITIALILILLSNPYCIFNVSFILSFTAFIGIILFSKRIDSFFNVYITKIIGLDNVNEITKGRSNIYLVMIYKLLKLISNILSLYFSVMILILPIQIYFFNSITAISIVSNVVIYIFSSVQLILGYLFVFVCYIPYFSDVLANFNYLLLWIIIRIVNALVSLNAFEIKLPTPDILSIFCYYIFVVFSFYGYRLIYYFKYKFKKINVKLVFRIIYFSSVIYIIYFNIYTTYFLSFVYFFNVEQGNMTLIKSGSKAILVDMGTTGKCNLTSILESFMNAYNIDKIDYLLVTHLHSDHINGLFELEEKLSTNKITIGSVIYAIPKNEDSIFSNNYTENSISYLEFENFLNRFKIKQIMCEKFDNIVIDKDISIDILNPRNKEIIKSKDIVNSNSIVSVISVKNSNLLFMGDSTIESERVILEDISKHISIIENKEAYLNKLKNIQAVQIGHHGSNTSTSDYFLNNIHTNFAVISSKKSAYGHPSSTVVNILKKYNIPTYITERDGGIYNLLK